jgi:ankyrin repeat protein
VADATDRAREFFKLVKRGDVECVRRLLAEEPSLVNARDAEESTPLHHAAAHGNQKAVAEILLARGADLHAPSCNGRTPIQETTFHNATTVANLLKRHGAALPE